ncbi:MAG: YceI family protein [Rhodothermia bacterium]
MKTTTLLIPALFLLTGWAAVSAQTQFPIASESRMWIDGTSNVHDWTCDVGVVEGFVESDELWNVVAEITVPISSIECKNGKMDKKLQDALKAEDHPTISFVADSIAVTGDPDAPEIVLAVTGRLTVAGTTRVVKMIVTSTELPGAGYRLTGELPVSMKDFNVKPPRAMLGLIKTGKEVKVRFEIIVSPPQT